MRRLNRGDEPACLHTFQHGRDSWSDVNPAQKAEIWDSLREMQGERCAYCECDIGTQRRHIEHFIQKGRVPQETFNWANLFGSCCVKDTCGYLKDRVGVYNHADVIKPDIDDPDEFLLYLSDGTIRPLEDLHQDQEVKARTTLEVLGLHHNNGPLRNMRRQAVEGYIQTAEIFAELSLEDPENKLDWRAELEEELQNVAGLPFSTAIRHMFKSYVDF